MKKTILIQYAIPKEGLKALSQSFDLIYPDKDCFTQEEMLKHIPNCEALLSIFNQPVNADLIEAGKKLEIISNYGVGYNNIDVEAATQRGIAVCNTPEAVCEPTAELCLSLMLALTRRVAECNHRLKTEADFKWGVMRNLGQTLRGKTLGIIGMGKIGKSVALKAQAFGMKVVYNNRTQLSASKEASLNIDYLGFEDLLKTADVISLHCPLNESTHHLISEKELKIMKTSAYLINTARGPVVDEQALAVALKNNLIAGAGLDVFEDEPHITEQLMTRNDVVLVPHIGTACIETRIEMAEEAAQNILDHWEKGKSKNQVN
ncbi:NAD(P)-dependent oxidoreductase [Ancylomarina euxinus]|uniref:NAD(P)-dependent oxidoreductase n=1 Tax=Ancylomarina euxinus TaxID=2283627 RepID=UPI0018CCC307|nr:NAD(P)-dependent oxidoreductase [Ancylomarina euxinus]MCZ4696269.1 NAD(P)-dependent oxidoreductase [Ancylomarina euxinus]